MKRAYWVVKPKQQGEDLWQEWLLSGDFPGLQETAVCTQTGEGWCSHPQKVFVVLHTTVPPPAPSSDALRVGAFQYLLWVGLHAACPNRVVNHNCQALLWLPLSRFWKRLFQNRYLLRKLHLIKFSELPTSDDNTQLNRQLNRNAQAWSFGGVSSLSLLRLRDPVASYKSHFREPRSPAATLFWPGTAIHQPQAREKALWHPLISLSFLLLQS